MRLSMAGLALIVACTAVPAPETTTTTKAASTTVPPTTTTVAVTTAVWAADPDFTLRVGVEAGEADAYGVPQQPSLYRLVPPTATLIPLLAVEAEPPLGHATDDGWEIIVPLRPWVTWDDGTPVIAGDVVASFQRGAYARGLDLLRAVEAVDNHTVRLLWEERPTIEEWQLGVALAPIVPAGYTPEATDLPTTGPYRLAEVDSDGWALEAVSGWWEAGSTITVWENAAVAYRNPTLDLKETYGEPAGEVVAEWTLGPYASRVEYRVFEDFNEISVAVVNGDLDLVLSKQTISRGLQLSFLELDDWAFTGGPSSTLYWVAFNTLKRPFNDLAARRAATCSFDPQFLGETVLAGAGIPAGWGTGLGPWQTTAEPVCGAQRNPGILEDHKVKTISLGPGYNPLAATSGLWVGKWLSDLGADVLPYPGSDSSPWRMAEQLADPEAWNVAIISTEIDPIRLVIDPEEVSRVTGWHPPGARLLAELTHNAYTLATAQEATRRLQQLWAEDVPSVPLFQWRFIELFNVSTIAPPFLSRDGDGYTTPLLDGLQAWESWVIPATRPAGG